MGDGESRLSLTSAGSSRCDYGLLRATSPEAVTIWQFASEEPREALQARRFFLASLRQHAGSLVDEFAAKIIFSELVSNVIRHAPGPITITLMLYESCVIIRVDDTGCGFDCNWSLPNDPYSEGGRGLFIASTYATDVSIALRDGGASVFATIAFKAHA